MFLIWRLIYDRIMFPIFGGGGSLAVVLVPGHQAVEQLALVMSNQRFFKSSCFRFPTNVPKKSNIFVFEKKFIIEPKRSLSDFKILDPKAFSFFSFQIFFETSKRSVLVLEICELNQNVLVLFLSFWNK